MTITVVIDQNKQRIITNDINENNTNLTYLDCSQTNNFNQIPNNLLHLKEIRVSGMIEIPDTLFNITKIIFNTGRIQSNNILLSDSTFDEYKYNHEYGYSYDDEISNNYEHHFYYCLYESDFKIKLNSEIQIYCFNVFADYNEYNDGYVYDFDSFDTICDKEDEKFYNVVTIFHQSKLDEYTNKLNKFNKIKHGFVKFVKIYKHYKHFKILWKIAEYYTKRKYSPNNILMIINLDE